jgi:hypothetical protein
MTADSPENARFSAISAQVTCFEKFHLGCIFRDEYEIK